MTLTNEQGDIRNVFEMLDQLQTMYNELQCRFEELSARLAPIEAVDVSSVPTMGAESIQQGTDLATLANDVASIQTTLTNHENRITALETP